MTTFDTLLYFLLVNDEMSIKNPNHRKNNLMKIISVICPIRNRLALRISPICEFISRNDTLPRANIIELRIYKYDLLLALFYANGGHSFE